MRYLLFVLPNLLSLSRIGFGLWVALLIQDPQNAYFCLWLMFFAAWTDIFDGALARYLEVESDFGCRLDPVCDGIFLISILSAIVYAGYLPIWYLVCVFVRYIILYFMHYHLFLLGFRHVSALWSGKFTAFFCFFLILNVFITLYWPFRFHELWVSTLLWLSTLLLCFSFVFYMVRYVQLMSKRDHNQQISDK